MAPVAFAHYSIVSDFKKFKERILLMKQNSMGGKEIIVEMKNILDNIEYVEEE